MASLVIIPGVGEGASLVKAAVAAAGAGLVLAVPGSWRVDTRVSAALIACVVALGVAAWRADIPSVSWWGRYPRYEGVWILALYLVCVAAGARIVGHRVAVGWLLSRVVPAVAWLVLGVGLAQLGTGGGAREGSVFGNAADLGGWGACVVIGTLSSWWSGMLPGGRLKVWVLSGAVAAGGAVLLSGSRGAVVACLVVGTFAAVLTRPGWRVLAATGGTLAVLALVLLGVGVGGVSRAIGDTSATSTLTGRTQLWADTLALLRNHWATGVGPSGFVDAIGHAHSTAWAATVGPTNPPDSPHLLLLQVAVAAGLAGIVTLMAVAVTAARPIRIAWATRRADTTVAGTVLAAYLAAMAAEFTSPVLTPAAAVIVGWLCAQRGPTRMPQWRTLALPATATLVMVVTVTAVIAESQVASGLSALTTGDGEGALGRFAAARAWEPWNPDLVLRQGHAFSQAAQNGLIPPSTCLASTRAARNALPHSSEAALNDALCREVAGDLTGAARVLGPARTWDPTNVNLWLSAGVIAAEAGNPTQAVDLLLRAAALAPSDPEPWTDLAVVYDRTGQTTLANQARATAASLTQVRR